MANGGTTLTGSVDPLDGLADVCAEAGVWLHVDGAYGLPAASTARARHLFAGLERVDSVTLDAHKWLGIQKGCSVVLVRESGALERSFGHEESYIRRTGAREPGRAHAGVLAADQLAEAVAGAAHPRRRRLPGLDRAHARAGRRADRARWAPTPSSS